MPVSSGAPPASSRKPALYMVATPIGNAADLSERARDVLRNAGLVACEDTRRTVRLLTHFGIKARLLSCRQANETSAGHKVLAALAGGVHAVYVSDAGSPALSDPGARLAAMVCEAGYQVIPVPGPSAFSALVSVAGVGDKSVVFEGFLSPKQGRRRSRIRELLDFGAAFVVYESPRRVLKLFGDLAEQAGGRYCCVGREMTKQHEEYLRGTVDEVYRRLQEAGQNLGEFAVYVSGRQGA